MEQGFLDALRDAPDDRVSHLVFADWLDDAGQAERAEYVRAWWRVEALPRRERAAAHEEVRKRHQGSFQRWLGPGSELAQPAFAGAVVARLDWEARGQPRAEALAGLLERNAVRLLVLGPIPSAGDLARLPGFGHIREVVFLGPSCDDFFLWSHLPPLRRLAFGELGTGTARLLARTPGLKGLRSIIGLVEDDAAVVALLKSPHLAGLEEWHLTGGRVTPLSLLHLFRDGRAARWRALSYTNEQASLSDIRAVGRCVNLRRLSLALPPYLSDERPLECLEPLKQLRELHLTGVGQTALAQLGAWPGLRGLEALSINGRYAHVAGSLRPLLDSPFLNPETVLDIPGVTP